ncbi:MAG: hypothetical protein WCZ10_11975 [Desulfobulbaceae bacterium]|jgi:hypothetical protein
MARQAEGETMLSGKTIPACIIAGMLLCSPAHGTDHLSESNSCTPCHGTNIRKVHDYDYTIPTDCDICHATQGSTWYLNYMCADYLTAGGVPIVEIEAGAWVLDLPEYSDFNFECKVCHVGRNPGHQQ